MWQYRQIPRPLAAAQFICFEQQPRVGRALLHAPPGFAAALIGKAPPAGAVQVRELPLVDHRDDVALSHVRPVAFEPGQGLFRQVFPFEHLPLFVFVGLQDLILSHAIAQCRSPSPIIVRYRRGFLRRNQICGQHGPRSVRPRQKKQTVERQKAILMW